MQSGNHGPTPAAAQNLGVAAVPPPPRPLGVAPSITQGPATTPYPFFGAGGQPFPGAATQPTYPGSQLPAAFYAPNPQVLPTPGPSTFGPGGPAGSVGGVPAVSMTPVATVAPPAATGGPHPLPALPQLPLPQGFPNPFQLGQLAQQLAPQQAPPLQGPMTLTTGPAGYLPGLGQFQLPPGPPPQPAFQIPASPAFQIPTQQVPTAPQPAVQAPPPTAAQTAPVTPADAFWHHLAWQLLQSQEVRQALGARFAATADGPDRMRYLQTAVLCLRTDPLQASFRALASGGLEQARFLEQFSATLKSALLSAGLWAGE